MCVTSFKETLLKQLRSNSKISFVLGLTSFFCLSFWWENENQFRLDARGIKKEKEEKIESEETESCSSSCLNVDNTVGHINVLGLLSATLLIWSRKPQTNFIQGISVECEFEYFIHIELTRFLKF